MTSSSNAVKSSSSSTSTSSSITMNGVHVQQPNGNTNGTLIPNPNPGSKPTPKPADDVIASRDMCAHAFCILLSRLSLTSVTTTSSTSAITIPPSLSSVIPPCRGGVFVTWSTPSPASSSTYVLRGCIGTLKPAPSVADAVARYAAHAAFNDPRFDPINAHELPLLKVGVSVLSRFERAGDAYDWSVGVHGIILDVDHGRFSATYLPEVCEEHQWSKQHCVQSLAEKAGYRGILKGKALKEATVTRYQSSKCEMTYEQFLKYVNGMNGAMGEGGEEEDEEEEDIGS